MSATRVALHLGATFNLNTGRYSKQGCSATDPLLSLPKGELGEMNTAVALFLVAG